MPNRWLINKSNDYNKATKREGNGISSEKSVVTPLFCLLFSCSLISQQIINEVSELKRSVTNDRRLSLVHFHSFVVSVNISHMLLPAYTSLAGKILDMNS